MRQIIPNIAVDNCKEALEYYKKTFGGEVKNLQMADGKEMFRGHEGKIIHSELHINSTCVLYLFDNIDQRAKGDNISIILLLDSEDEINRLFSALSKDGSVSFALQKTFWGSFHAVVTDRYGITWSMDFADKAPQAH